MASMPTMPIIQSIIQSCSSRGNFNYYLVDVDKSASTQDREIFHRPRMPAADHQSDLVSCVEDARPTHRGSLDLHTVDLGTSATQSL